jgi:cobalt/nickel transport system permease protein
LLFIKIPITPPPLLDLLSLMLNTLNHNLSGFDGSALLFDTFFFAPHFALHIPDGYLSLPIMAITWVFAILLIAIALKKVQQSYQDRSVALMGVCAAFIFAAQMINFQIPGGSSGHLLGGTLAGALLGPWAGSLVMVAVFMVQGLLFQDGGLTVMGANIFNMGLIGTFGGYFLYRAIRNMVGHDSWRGMAAGLAVAAWCSVMVAAIVCAVQIGASGFVSLPVALSAMSFWHLFIGIGEALISVATASFIWRTRPDVFFDPPRKLRVSGVRASSLR